MQYLFKHVLMRDVVYEMQLGRQLPASPTTHMPPAALFWRMCRTTGKLCVNGNGWSVTVSSAPAPRAGSLLREGSA